MNDVQLDHHQAAAATTTAPHVLVVSGPGAGKTRTLTARVGHLLDQGADPSRILAVTFTNAAAGELVDRIGRPDLEWVGTFHSVLRRLVVRPYAARFGRKSPEVADDDEAFRALKVVARRLASENPSLSIPTRVDDLRQWAADFSWYKNAVRKPTEPARLALFAAYDEYLAARDLVDFDDLLLLPVELMSTEEDVRQEVASSFDHVLVDEYQDTNTCQVQLVRLLCSEEASLFVVGDPAQSIYGFRGADPGNVSSLGRIFPDLVTYELPITYRCPTSVINLANRIGASALCLVPSVENARRKGVARPLPCGSLFDQGAKVAREITRLLDNACPAREIAVLYRRRSVPSETGITKLLRENGVPFREVGAWT